MHITEHAKRRMIDRNIGPATVAAVVISGTARWSRVGLQVICELCGYAAVVDPLTDTLITIYEHDRRAS